PLGFGPAAGVILTSADRAGRRFPLSIVALLPAASIGFISSADPWFVELEEVGFGAQLGKLTPDELERALTLFGSPAANVNGEIVEEMGVWTACSDIFDIDPNAPHPVLEQLFAANCETG